METIIDSIEVCHFVQAKSLLAKEFEIVVDKRKGWDLHMVSLYLTIKEKEHSMSVQEKDLKSSIDSFVAILSQIQSVEEHCCEELLTTELCCCVNLLSLVNCTENTSLVNEAAVMDKICECLRRVIKFYWSETSSLPPHSFNPPTPGYVSGSLETLTAMLLFYDRVISPCKDIHFLEMFSSLLTELALNLLMDGSSGQLQELIYDLLNQCMGQFKKLSQSRTFITNKRKMFSTSFLKFEYADLQRHYATLRALRDFPCKQEKITRCGDCEPRKDQMEFVKLNSLLFIVKGLTLLYNEEYERCMEYLDKVQSSTLLLSKLSVFQFFLFKNMIEIVSIKLNTVTMDTNDSNCHLLSPTYKKTDLLNKTALALQKNDTEDSIKHLELLTRIDSRSSGEDKHYAVTNFEYRVEKYLKKLLSQRFSHIVHGDVKHFLYIEKCPAVYVFQTLSIQLRKVNRFKDACKIYEKLMGRFDRMDIFSGGMNPQSSLEDIDIERVYQKCCFCYLKSYQDEKALELITQLKYKDHDHVWMFLYEGEAYRRQLQFDKCVSTWKKGIECCKIQTKTSHGVAEASDKQAKTYHKSHFLNNLCVVHMRMKKEHEAFKCIKEGILGCQQDAVPIFEELAYNYCKWLADHKSRDIALLNWRELRTPKETSSSSNSFQKEYTIFI